MVIIYNNRIKIYMIIDNNMKNNNKMSEMKQHVKEEYNYIIINNICKINILKY